MKTFTLTKTLVLICVAAVVPLTAEAMPSLCGATGECVCVTWTGGSSATVEVRCPAGGTDRSGWQIGSNPPDGSGGSWGGSGNPKDPLANAPGTALSGTTSFNASSAKSGATVKLRGEKVPDMKGVWEPTACTMLFHNNPMGRSGADLMANYVILRDGTGVKDSAGNEPCKSNVAAWTTCCNHDRYVFICPSKFDGLSSSQRQAILIHEVMHVAGQMEDGTTSVGPGDHPTSPNITAEVEAACGL